jgi:hypothetical protein
LFLTALQTRTEYKKQLKFVNKFLTLAVVFIIIFPTDTTSMQSTILN